MFTLNIHPRTRPNPNLPILTHQSTKTHNPIPHMALRIHLLPSILPSQPIKFHPYPSLPTHLFTNTPKTLISYCTKKTQDSDLASDLAKELQKINTHFVQREEAMKKSRELLVNDLCQHLGFKTEELKKKWGNLSEDDKCVLIKGFVEEWGVNFHPLSAKSVKEMVDEQLGEESHSVKNSSLLGSDENLGDFTKEISWF